jgi:hypothetical protein
MIKGIIYFFLQFKFSKWNYNANQRVNIFSISGLHPCPYTIHSYWCILDDNPDGLQHVSVLLHNKQMQIQCWFVYCNIFVFTVTLRILHFECQCVFATLRHLGTQTYIDRSFCCSWTETSISHFHNISLYRSAMLCFYLLFSFSIKLSSSHRTSRLRLITVDIANKIFLRVVKSATVSVDFLIYWRIKRLIVLVVFCRRWGWGSSI